MENVILFDREPARTGLLPLTFTRPVADIRVGALTIRQKWERMLHGTYSWLTQGYLSVKFGISNPADRSNLFIAGDVLPDPRLVAMIPMLEEGQALTDARDDSVIAFRGSLDDFKKAPRQTAPIDVKLVSTVIDVFKLNGDEIRNDFRIFTDGVASAPISDTNVVIGDRSQLFVEEGCEIECASFNVKHGPIYIAKGVEIMEGARLRGPIAIMADSKVKMNTMIYEDTTVGPQCRVAGELANAVIQGYSNKAHDGVLLNAVVGEWCNIGAAATSSNLKNNYAKIKVWSYEKKGFVKTDEQFCGLIMGDYSKLAINTSLNTATTVGVGVNFFGAGFPRTYIPSFSFGSPLKMTKCSLDELIDTARIVMSRRHVDLTQADIDIMTYLYNQQD